MDAMTDRTSGREELPVTPEIREQLLHRRSEGRRTLLWGGLSTAAVTIGGSTVGWIQAPGKWPLIIAAVLLALLLVLVIILAIVLEVSAGRRVRTATFLRTSGFATIKEHLQRGSNTASTFTLELSGGPGSECYVLPLSAALADHLRRSSGVWLAVEHSTDDREILAVRDEQDRRIG